MNRTQIRRKGVNHRESKFGPGVLELQYAATRGRISARGARKSQNELSKKIFVPDRFESIESKPAILLHATSQTGNRITDVQSWHTAADRLALSEEPAQRRAASLQTAGKMAG